MIQFRISLDTKCPPHAAAALGKSGGLWKDQRAATSSGEGLDGAYRDPEVVIFAATDLGEEQTPRPNGRVR